ncbi:transketolase [Insolitispirillum peregrinum]|uniref:transketolase n=1 Tax=Insolitispirillum peregrinum TaxID=80876 RepID=UPI00360DE394
MTSETVSHAQLANAIRFLSADAVQKANSGHPGMPLGMADVAAVLFTRFMKFDADQPRWPDRDRFVLSAGHGSMLLYSLGYLLGYRDVTREELENFRQLGHVTAGHPEFGHIQMADTTTGPLGQGITNAVGMALAEKMLAARFGGEVVDHFTYVIAGDGCLMEGVSQEAISLAGHWKLNKLVLLWDDNEICIDGKVSLAQSDDQILRFQASGWNTIAIDGHDPVAIAAALEQARSSDKPTMIACKTTIGKGAPTLAGSEKTHGAPLGDKELAGMRDALGWPYAPFEVPDDILSVWRAAGTRGSAERLQWEKRVDALPADAKVTFVTSLQGRIPEATDAAIDAFKQKMAADTPKVATRKASQMVLEAVVPTIPQIVGGSADLTHSNLTITKDMKSVLPTDFTGNYIHYGVREHGMGSIMNGIALHGGLIPYGGTFMVFSDYCRPSIRMSALMEQRVIYVMTHDSIGLGEDGPTHQPVEHLASLRAMPNLRVFRPADPIETAECWQLALQWTRGPSFLALSRQNLPTVRTYTRENLCQLGGYVLSEPEDGKRDVTILASGSEVELALKSQVLLNAVGIKAAVVSMPCWELFDAQPTTYRKAVLGDGLRIAVEAGSTFGWERYVGLDGAIVGMTSFGASGPADQLYKHFGITAEAVADIAVARLKQNA